MFAMNKHVHNASVCIKPHTIDDNSDDKWFDHFWCVAIWLLTYDVLENVKTNHDFVRRIMMSVTCFHPQHPQVKHVVNVSMWLNRRHTIGNPYQSNSVIKPRKWINRWWQYWWYYNLPGISKPQLVLEHLTCKIILQHSKTKSYMDHKFIIQLSPIVSVETVCSNSRFTALLMIQWHCWRWCCKTLFNATTTNSESLVIFSCVLRFQLRI